MIRVVPSSRQQADDPGGGEPDPLAAFNPEGADPTPVESSHARPAATVSPAAPIDTAPRDGHDHDASGRAAPRHEHEVDEARPRGPSAGTAVLLICAVLAVVAGGIVVFQFQGGLLSAPTPTIRTGRLTLETRPPGAFVEIEGQLRGATPLALELAVGEHAVTLRHGAEERTLSVNMTAGAQVTQYLELAQTQVATAPVGHLTVVTEPPGARVSINGQVRGVSPVTVRDLEATRHNVTVAGATGSAERMVDVESGGTTSVVFALGRPGVTAGWLSVQAPFDVQIAQGADFVGSSAAPRVLMAAGRHNMTFSNAELGFEDRRQVEIRPGATTTVQLAAVAALNINARPWADVSIDGESLGQTPIANHSVALGSHVVVFRHPQLGERRQTVLVTARGPNRISVDLTR